MNKIYLFLFVCFLILLLLDQKYPLKGGVGICSNSTIINKNFENKIKKIFISDFQIKKTDLETQSYESLSKTIKEQIKKKSDNTKKDIEDKIKDIEEARKSAFSYSFNTPYKNLLTGGYYTLCDTNNNISSNKYIKLFKLVYTEILSHKKQLKKLAELNLPGSVGHPPSLKNSFYKKLLSYIVPQNAQGEKLIHGSRGTIFGRAATGNGGENMSGNIGDYKRKMNWVYNQDDINIKKKSGALNFILFNWEIVTTLSTEEKMNTLAACYKYLFNALPLISVQARPPSQYLLNNIYFNKKVVYKGIKKIKTLDYQNNEHLRECISFDIDHKNKPNNVTNGMFHYWFTPKAYNKNLIQFYDNDKLTDMINSTKYDNGFFFGSSHHTPLKTLFINLGFRTNIEPWTSKLRNTKEYTWIRIGNLVLPKNKGVEPQDLTPHHGGFTYQLSIDREPEIIKQ